MRRSLCNLYGGNRSSENAMSELNDEHLFIHDYTNEVTGCFKLKCTVGRSVM